MPDRLERFIRDAQALQGPHDEAPRGKLALETRVILEPALGHDARAVLVDDGRQFLGPVYSETRLHQQFHAANVGDSVLVLDPKPERFAGRAELSGRIRSVLYKA